MERTINLAHGLGLHVTAEGVEDAETLHALAGMGCDMIQDYFTGRPAPVANYTEPQQRPVQDKALATPHLASTTT